MTAVRVTAVVLALIASIPPANVSVDAILLGLLIITIISVGNELVTILEVKECVSLAGVVICMCRVGV